MFRDLIGVPYKFNGRDRSGMDCLGILIEGYKRMGFPEVFDDGKPIEENWFETDKYRFYRYLCKHFDKTNLDSLEAGDIVLLEINGESHVLLMIDKYGKFISTFPQRDFSWGFCFIDRISYVLRDSRVKFVTAFKRR